MSLYPVQPIKGRYVSEPNDTNPTSDFRLLISAFRQESVPLGAAFAHTGLMVDDGKHGYRKLRVYQLAHDLGDRVHAMTLTLPYFEHRETGSQIRRSSKGVSAQIVEGYKLRKYRDEFLHYLHRAAASAEETREHLSYLMDTGSLKDIKLGRELDSRYVELSAGLARFITGIERDHSKPFYLRPAEKPPPKSGIRNPPPPHSAIRNPSSQQSEIRNPQSPQ